MTIKKWVFYPLLYIFYWAAPVNDVLGQSIKISDNSKEKIVKFGNEKIVATLDYNNKASISLLTINGQNAIAGRGGIYTEIKTATRSYSSLALSAQASLKINTNTIVLEGIRYGDENISINERWTFTITKDNIHFDIERNLSKNIIAEKNSLPVFVFNNINNWEGAYQDYGGLAWFYLFNHRLDTYGVYSNSSDFWSSKTGNGLRVSVVAPGRQVAMDYSRTVNDELAYTVTASAEAPGFRFDSGTHRRRYVRDTAWVWASVKMPAGKTKQRITLSYFNFSEKYGRGKLKGVNEEQVNSVLNTIARIGVIGKQHFGGNSWHTPYGPICLHEQYIAQLGLAINDDAYLKGYRQCLDFYRDNAIKPDGRVWSRWAYSNEDAMPGEYTDKGFYEARWGYLLDANPDFVTNVAELYDQNGDIKWVKTHQLACESALDYIIKKDSNRNGLVEMATGSHKQKKGSDWIDIVWASYENAFVNAKLYHALVVWADIERQLANTGKQQYYLQFAQKLKTSFNRNTAEGGFWDAEKSCYIHWRDKDGSVHGNNMVTPVNFMSIAYGICDDAGRTKTILDTIEVQMQKENLFFWPLCLYSYAPGEANDWQFPFPNYENGDIFLSWGSVAVKAYAGYKPELALKYVKNVLAQYAKDGLAYQRYGRVKQDGLGDDILSGNSLSVVGLYQSVYGINPLYNRFFLDPHITQELAGTRVKYKYRGQQLEISLDTNNYTISTERFSINASAGFGFFSDQNKLSYFNGNKNSASLIAETIAAGKLRLEIKEWGADRVKWTQRTAATKAGRLKYDVSDLSSNTDFSILQNNKLVKNIKSDKYGHLVFECLAGSNTDEWMVVNNRDFNKAIK